MPSIVYKLPKEVAKAVAHEMSPDKYIVRPWNRFKDDSDWWLIPGNNNPAYEYGKYVFLPENAMLNCGYYVEKGLEKEAMNPKDMMCSDWMWHSFIRGLQAGEVTEACRVVNSLTKSPVLVRITVSFANGVKSTKLDEVEWLYDQGNLVIKTVPKSELTVLKKAVNLKDIATILKGNKKLSWFWVDFMLLVQFTMSDEGYDASMLCKDVFDPFTQWVAGRKSK